LPTDKQEMETRTANQPDGANRRQPLGFREFVGQSSALAFTAAVAHPCRWTTGRQKPNHPMNKSVGAFLAFVSIIALLVSCSRGSPIIGRWQEIGGDNETMDFSKSGTFHLVSKGRTIEGKYSMPEDGRIKLELGGAGAELRPIVVQVALSGDELSMSDPFTKVSKYRRTK
jgi:hypothetical protein